MTSREKTNRRPEQLPFGVTLALSLGGIIYCFLKSRTVKLSESPPSSLPSSDCGDQTHSYLDRNDNHELHTKDGLGNSTTIGQDEYEELPLPKCHDESFPADYSPNSIVHRDKDMDTSDSECVEKGASGNEQEFRMLRNMVKILKEREESLEIQLLEYYGLKEQETAVRELQNRLKLNNMEAKLFNLKIESLQAHKKRLEEQVTDNAKLAGELEAAKAKIKLLNKQLRSEAEQNRENILALQKRVKKLQEEENKSVAADNLEIQIKLQKLKDLEEEAEELKKTNSNLRLENSGLAQNLEYVQLIATSAMDADETTILKKECHHLRKENEELTNKVELLQANRCSDAEELVYLRWLNACLRYELRNYQPSPGRTSAKELSKTLSLASEEKAKQLILQYGSSEGMTSNGRNLGEYDSDRLSSSHSGEYIISPNKTKTKGLGKLMCLLRGKDSNDHRRVPLEETSAYIEDAFGKCLTDSPGCHSGFTTVTGTDGTHSRSTSRSSRYSLDIPRTSDDTTLMQPNKLDHSSENIEKSELMKYAEALRVSRDKPLKRRSASSTF